MTEGLSAVGLICIGSFIKSNILKNKALKCAGAGGGVLIQSKHSLKDNDMRQLVHSEGKVTCPNRHAMLKQCRFTVASMSKTLNQS